MCELILRVQPKPKLFIYFWLFLLSRLWD